MPGNSQGRRSRSLPLIALVSAVGALVIAGAVAVALTTHVARLVVTPPRRRDEDIRILASTNSTITLSATTLSASADIRTAGRYGFWFSGDSGYARIGAQLSATATTVTRELLGVDFGDLHRAKRGRFSGWFYLGPSELGLPFEDVDITTPIGAAPAWLIPSTRDSSRWAIHTHGRGVTRAECLRGVPVFRDAGFTSLLISYRNDGVAPDSADRRYGLGGTEWRDLEAAIDFAVDHGAKSIVLVGWSMGGATTLQASMLSRHRELLLGIVLDSPVVDWVRVLHFQAAAMRLPLPIRRAVLAVLGSARGGLLTGQSEPLDFQSLNIVERAHELDVPTLLLHSSGDAYVPVDPSRALAALRPDLITFEEFSEARHARLWNYDQPRWEAAIATWLARLTTRRATSGRRER
jgi:pimeloyl-ACP methyl ester carboxylesterase